MISLRASAGAQQAAGGGGRRGKANKLEPLRGKKDIQFKTQAPTPPSRPVCLIGQVCRVLLLAPPLFGLQALERLRLRVAAAVQIRLKYSLHTPYVSGCACERLNHYMTRLHVTERFCSFPIEIKICPSTEVEEGVRNGGFNC